MVLNQTLTSVGLSSIQKLFHVGKDNKTRQTTIRLDVDRWSSTTPCKAVNQEKLSSVNYGYESEILKAHSTVNTTRAYFVSSCPHRDWSRFHFDHVTEKICFGDNYFNTTHQTNQVKYSFHINLYTVWEQQGSTWRVLSSGIYSRVIS
jgi:hypothetical protein